MSDVPMEILKKILAKLLLRFNETSEKWLLDVLKDCNSLSEAIEDCFDVPKREEEIIKLLRNCVWLMIRKELCIGFTPIGSREFNILLENILEKGLCEELLKDWKRNV